jgi:hypothetical protein
VTRPRLPTLACALGLLAACGLRTGTTDDQEEGDTFGMTDPTEADPREGSCDTPFVLPFANTEVRGRLLGPGSVRGWCGRQADGDPDAGPEDSYLITPTFNVDATIVVPQSDFTPSLRVTRDGCREDVLPQLCAAPMGTDIWHFFAEVGHTYTVTIDSPENTDGNYTMQVVYGDPGIGACPVHPTQITQEPGGYFTWSNTLGKRPGRVDGLCGGPGGENMFQLNVGFPGFIRFRVEASQGFRPVLSVRTGCGGVTELQCTSADATGSNILELGDFFDPGTYFVVVDQGGVDGGDYKLEVFSE